MKYNIAQEKGGLVHAGSRFAGRYCFSGIIRFDWKPVWFVVRLRDFGSSGVQRGFLTGRKGAINGDEHDQAIGRRSRTAAFGVFWFYYVGGAVLLSLNYLKSIPSDQFLAYFILGVVVFIAAQAITVLVLYRVDATNRMTLVDWLRNLSGLRKWGLAMLVMTLFVMTPFHWAMVGVSSGEAPPGFGYLVCGSFAVVYLLSHWFVGRFEQAGSGKRMLARVRRTGDWAMGIALLGLLLGVGLIWVLPVEIEIAVRVLQIIFSILFVGLISLSLGAIIFGRNDATHILPNSPSGGDRL